MEPDFLLKIGIMTPMILMALSVHECAHAWTARSLGDSTADDQGRVSLNPFVHLDWMGAIAFVICGFGLAALARIPDEISLWRARTQADMLSLTALDAALLAERDDTRSVRLFEAADLASAAGRDEDAARWLRESVALGRTEPAVLAGYAVLLKKSGRPRGAALIWKDLAERADVDAGVRELARTKAAALAR